MHILLFLLIDIIIDSRVLLLNGDTFIYNGFIVYRAAPPPRNEQCKHSPGSSNAPLREGATQERKKDAKANSFTLAIFCVMILSQDFVSHCIKESATISYDVITIRLATGINTLEDVFFCRVAKFQDGCAVVYPRSALSSFARSSFPSKSCGQR